MELINLLRQETTFIEELIGVDCDSEVLTSNFKKFQIRAFDHLNARNKPLKISCYQVGNLFKLIDYLMYLVDVFLTLVLIITIFHTDLFFLFNLCLFIKKIKFLTISLDQHLMYEIIIMFN